MNRLSRRNHPYESPIQQMGYPLLRQYNSLPLFNLPVPCVPYPPNFMSHSYEPNEQSRAVRTQTPEDPYIKKLKRWDQLSRAQKRNKTATTSVDRGILVSETDPTPPDDFFVNMPYDPEGTVVVKDYADDTITVVVSPRPCPFREQLPLAYIPLSPPDPKPLNHEQICQIFNNMPPLKTKGHANLLEIPFPVCDDIKANIMNEERKIQESIRKTKFKSVTANFIKREESRKQNDQNAALKRLNSTTFFTPF